MADIQTKKRRALAGAAIGLIFGLYHGMTELENLNTFDYVVAWTGTLLTVGILGGLIGGGLKGFAALFSRS